MEQNKQLPLVFQMMEKQNRITFEDSVYICTDNEIFDFGEEITAEEIRPLVIDEAELSSLDVSSYNDPFDQDDTFYQTTNNSLKMTNRSDQKQIQVFSYKSLNDGKVRFLSANDFRFEQMYVEAQKKLVELFE